MKAGSLICWTDGGYGHIGYIAEVKADGSAVILEANFAGKQYIANHRAEAFGKESFTLAEIQSQGAGTISIIHPK